MLTAKIVAKTQADGAQTINPANAYNHTLAVTTSATPAAGTLAVEVMADGGAWEQLIDSSTGTQVVIALTAPKAYTFQGDISGLRVTPASFDADKTYTVTLNSWGM